MDELPPVFSCSKKNKLPIAELCRTLPDTADAEIKSSVNLSSAQDGPPCR